MRQSPDHRDGAPGPGRPLPLSRLPQAPWRPVSRLRDLPPGGRDGRGRDARLCRTVLLSPLRLLRFRPHGRRDRSEPRIARCPRPADADLRKLDRASRILAARVSAHATIRGAIAMPRAGSRVRAPVRRRRRHGADAARHRGSRPRPRTADRRRTPGSDRWSTPARLLDRCVATLVATAGASPVSRSRLPGAAPAGPARRPPRASAAAASRAVPCRPRP